MTVSIPAWNAMGLLPPIDDAQPTSPDRSPYVVSLADLVRRFAITPARASVLEGFLRYRAALHRAGLVSGFQWLDGSFLENIELIEARDPNDMDVVTFYQLPPGTSQADLAVRAPEVFPLSGAGRLKLKADFHVDAFLVHLASPERIVRVSAYWYSMWSHRRDKTWKGFVQVDLDPMNDAASAAFLASLASPGVTP